MKHHLLAAWLGAALMALPGGGALAGEGLSREGEGVLRVCSDPDNMPFSNMKGEGFENRLAVILAKDLGLRLNYTWDALYRGFLRRTLREDDCDVVMGLPTDLKGVKTTRPYYETSYVFVSAPLRGKPPVSFDDPSLKAMKIGLQVIGMDGANTPPAMAIGHRSLGENVVGFAVWGDEDNPEPQRKMFEAVASGEIDVALAWGPVAGWYAKRYGTRLALTPVLADPQMPEQRFSWSISVGTRKIDGALRDKLQGALDRHRTEVNALLADYGIPLVDSRAYRDAS
jgi:mxaJ protein